MEFNTCLKRVRDFESERLDLMKSFRMLMQRLEENGVPTRHFYSNLATKNEKCVDAALKFCRRDYATICFLHNYDHWIAGNREFMEHFTGIVSELKNLYPAFTDDLSPDLLAYEFLYEVNPVSN